MIVIYPLILASQTQKKTKSSCHVVHSWHQEEMQTNPIANMLHFRRIALCVQFLFLVQSTLAYEIRSRQSTTWTLNRRNFFAASGAMAVVAITEPAFAVDIKVTPVAHTFITSSGTSKPIRENDATRFFTNAKVVFLIEGKDANPNLALEVLDLTVKRKAGEGPGVTPGKVHLLSSNKALTDLASSLGLETTIKRESVENVIATARVIPQGDVLIVGPISSAGVASDGKVLADTAAGLGTFVGGKTGNGVISVLLDGPRENVQFEAGGYPVSDLLWFSV